ncbi:hypothetical protein PC9H_002879 [Pleurotus ostreatus]|uniref:Heterokaryon incompatibility domain-containing protein n=1 Tax=Pleurotus ostreatus TaxID=5322 RepID=A0A8H6ZXY7_PLEOS|nr:uncharacterized protein PC9H_002879 [Pleurotus ostreatus]KAF7436053.1 hypothetical protein PC9H_002879 [Pleurotus ostreatus]
MYRWYRNSHFCIVYLSASRDGRIDNDPWFKRGWTLQELLAPRQLKFFYEDWSKLYFHRQYDIVRPRRVTLDDTSSEVSARKGSYYDEDTASDGEDEEEDEETVAGSSDLDDDFDDYEADDTPPLRRKNMSISEKLTPNAQQIEYNFMEDYDPSPANAWDVFRWLSKRTTSRPEDLSYCLLVLLDIQIPIAYGEGEERAFYRVQVECSHHVEDRSLFLWNGSRSRWNSMFADDPSAFQDSEMEYPGKPWTLSSNCLFDSHPTRTLDPSFSLTNCGLRIMVVLHPVEFVHVSTYPAKHEKHEYVLTIFKTGDTKVTLRWQGKSPASSKVTARWKVAVVGPANMPPSRSYDGKAHRNLLDTLDFRPRYLYRSLI